MPWKPSSLLDQRAAFCAQAQLRAVSFQELCARFGISRKTGYKWVRRRATEGREGLEERSRSRASKASAPAQAWRAEALRWRRRHGTWGAKKIRVLLAQRLGASGLPSVRTLERWYRAAGLLRPWRRTRRGPAVPHPGLTQAQRPQEVWTVDFKGWYRTGDGQRQEPLTIRDLHSRYLLAIRLLPNQSEEQARPIFRQLFRRYGLPEAIRVDNGAPFGGKGALGLTRLSVWWWRLGIRVEFMRPARPGDNAGHEQMHRIFAREVAAEAGATRRAEQRRIERWRRQYNEQRPHEALGQQTPHSAYRPHLRAGAPAWPALAALTYPAGLIVRRVRPHGDIKWQGRLRYLGRAFSRESVGLKELQAGIWEVYLGALLLGVLHASDPNSMRPAHWQRGAKPKP